MLRTTRVSVPVDAVRSLDGPRFAETVERITNNVLLEEWLALYHDDAVAEWIVDGVCERHEGRSAIRRAASVQAEVWRERRLRVQKAFECADDRTVVMTWTGGFGDGRTQFGTEIWTFREDLVVRHQLYAYLDVRPSTSWLARLRVFMASPGTTLAALRHQRREDRAMTKRS